MLTLEELEKIAEYNRYWLYNHGLIGYSSHVIIPAELNLTYTQSMSYIRAHLFDGTKYQGYISP